MIHMDFILNEAKSLLYNYLQRHFSALFRCQLQAWICKNIAVVGHDLLIALFSRSCCLAFTCHLGSLGKSPMSNLQKHGRLTALTALLGASRLDKHTREEREAYECLKHFEYIQHQPNESDFSSAVGRICRSFP